METYANTSSSSSSSRTFLSSCFSSHPASSIFTGFTATNILLLLPLSVFILCCGFQRWRKQRRDQPMNPIDVFTYHMVAMELAGIAASIACCCGAFRASSRMMGVGCNMFAINSCVKMFFHVLTCVERYVAVVHPMAYLSLSKTSGVTARNASIACVWAACYSLIALRILLQINFTVILFFCNLVMSLIVISFCSVCVLRVLLRPAPGDGADGGGGANDMKRRAFVTITAIMAVLLLRFGGNLVCMALASSSVLGFRVGCVVQVSGIWFCLPSSYVLPLLFLHRAEKLPCCRYKRESANAP
ncbi:uncharacterized protein V6R79_021932 [Siganus canaliculatus]